MEISGPWYVFIIIMMLTHYVIMYMTLINQLNTGQTGGPAGRDLNVVPAWMQGVTGKGVVVAVIDDGKIIIHQEFVR